MAKSWVINIFEQLKIKADQKKTREIPSKMWQSPLYFIAFGLGSGAMPFAPGTFGTLMAIPFYLMCQHFSLLFYCLCTLLFVIASMLICDKVSKEIHDHDHPGMCLDEFAGFFVTMIHAPSGFLWVTLGFILFRFFDIVKPSPISFIDKNIHGGFGMVLDDVIAGVFAMIIIQLLAHLI